MMIDEPELLNMNGIPLTRVFNGRKYSIRLQPPDKMHHAFYSQGIIRYERDARVIATNLRKKGHLARVVEVNNPAIGKKWVVYICPKQRK